MLNIWRKRIGETQKWLKLAYLFVSLFMAGTPFIYVRSIEPNQTVLEVLLVGIAAFWFALVGARITSTKQIH